MPTIQNIMDYANRKYPNTETNANKVIDLNDIHTNLYVKIARLKNKYEIYETQTIAGQLTYTFPENCSLDNIISVRVSRTTEITSATQWDNYEYAGLNDDTTVGKWYGDAGNGVIALLDYDRRIQNEGLSIRIFYYKRPNTLSSDDMIAVPELDEDYHDLLKFGLIQSIAAQGQNPDTEIADYWQKKFDEFLRDVEGSLSEKYNTNRTQSNQVSEYW